MHVYKNWTPAELSSLDGRTYLITGGNSGIGLEATQILTDHGANVVIGCRSAEKAMSAISLVNKNNPKANVQFVALDLTDPDSISAAVTKIEADHPKLDALINNAGVMQPPLRRTKEGFELQMGTNHFGHFALTGLLLPKLLATAKSRVVNVASTAHKFGHIDFDDLDWKSRGFSRMGSYGQSKLANLLFTAELNARLQSSGCRTICVAAHPGYSATNLQQSVWLFRAVTNRLVAQSAAMGALPTLCAALDPELQPDAPTHWLLELLVPVPPEAPNPKVVRHGPAQVFARRQGDAFRVTAVGGPCTGPAPTIELVGR